MNSIVKKIRSKGAKEKETDKDVFRCCCALAAYSKGGQKETDVDVDAWNIPYIAEDKIPKTPEVCILREIFKNRSMGGKEEPDKTIKEICVKDPEDSNTNSTGTEGTKEPEDSNTNSTGTEETKESEEGDSNTDSTGTEETEDEKANEERKKKRIRRIVRILWDIYCVAWADKRITINERILFDFLCVKLGILRIKKREQIYKWITARFVEKINNDVIEKHNKNYGDTIETIEPRKDDKKYHVKDIEEKLKEIEGFIDNKGINELKEKLEKIEGLTDNKDIKELEEKLKDIDILDKSIDKEKAVKSIEEKLKKIKELKELTDNKYIKELTENFLKRKDGFNKLYGKVLSEGLNIEQEQKDENSGNIEPYLQKIFDDDDLTIDLSVLTDTKIYFQSLLKVEKRENEEVEIGAFHEISELNGKELEVYWDYIEPDNNLDLKGKADAFYDFLNVILADDKVNKNEDILIKTCAILYGINEYEYLDLKDIRNRLNAQFIKDENENVDRYNNNRKKIIEDIRNALGKDSVFERNNNARFSLICSFALVDGSLGEREKLELYDIGHKDYLLSTEQIEKVIKEISAVDNQDESQKRQVNVNDILSNVPKDLKEKEKDLINCLRIIKSDDVITDAEKNAFELVCMFYGVKKRFFEKGEHKNNKKIGEKDLINPNSGKLERDAYAKVEQVIEYGTIKGPLLNGFRFALKKNYDEYSRHRMRVDRKTTIFAFVLFIVMSMCLLGVLNITAHKTYLKRGISSDMVQLYKQNEMKDSIILPLDSIISFNKAIANIHDPLITVAESYKQSEDKDSLEHTLDSIISFNKTIANKLEDLGSWIKVVESNKQSINIDSLKHTLDSVISFNGAIVSKHENLGSWIKAFESYKQSKNIDSLEHTLDSIISFNKTIANKLEDLGSWIKVVESNKQSINIDSLKHTLDSVISFNGVIVSKHKDLDSWIKAFESYKQSKNKDSLNVFDWCKNLCTKIDITKIDECIFTCMKNLQKMVQPMSAVFLWFIIAVLIVVFLKLKELWARLLKKFYKKRYFYISLFLLLLLLSISELHTSLMLLTAMLSIEWLILMRERMHGNSDGGEKQTHGGLLVVLVLMAIITDISFGMIELHQMYTFENILDKVFSALFLGCICFFVGKFMEMQYIHESDDMREMKRIVDKINKKDDLKDVNSVWNISYHFSEKNKI